MPAAKGPTKGPSKQELMTQSRDLTALVKEVKQILPQFSDDLVCEALISSNEEPRSGLVSREPYPSRCARTSSVKWPAWLCLLIGRLMYLKDLE